VDTQTEILIAPWVLQRHPQYWDKPDEFIPERWADDGTGSARLSCLGFDRGPWLTVFLDAGGAREKDSSLSFLAFSAGSRKCLGQQFAYMEAKLAVGKSYRVRACAVACALW
jgi:cytochrome P450